MEKRAPDGERARLDDHAPQRRVNGVCAHGQAPRCRKSLSATCGRSEAKGGVPHGQNMRVLPMNDLWRRMSSQYPRQRDFCGAGLSMRGRRESVLENMAADVWEVAKERGGWKRQKRLRKERRRVAVFKAALGRDERRLEIHDGARGGVGETYGSAPTRTDSRRRASTSRAPVMCDRGGDG